MMDAFRIAFEQQLRRVGENVLRQAENDRHQTHYQRHERGKVLLTCIAKTEKNHSVNICHF